MEHNSRSLSFLVLYSELHLLWMQIIQRFLKQGRQQVAGMLEMKISNATQCIYEHPSHQLTLRGSCNFPTETHNVHQDQNPQANMVISPIVQAINILLTTTRSRTAT